MEIEDKLRKFRQAKSLNDFKSQPSQIGLLDKFKQTFAATELNEHNSLRSRNKVLKQPSMSEIQEEKIDIDTTNQTSKSFLINVVLKFLLWIILLIIFIKLEFGIVYFVVSLLFLIYFNTSVRRKSGLSAYSVFNPNLERLHGTLTPEQVEKSLTGTF